MNYYSFFSGCGSLFFARPSFIRRHRNIYINDPIKGKILHPFSFSSSIWSLRFALVGALVLERGPKRIKLAYSRTLSSLSFDLLTWFLKTYFSDLVLSKAHSTCTRHLLFLGFSGWLGFLAGLVAWSEENIREQQTDWLD